jgi:hypothetical protein
VPLPQGIANPGGAFGLPLSGTNIGGATVMTNDGMYVEMVNNSAATRQYGDIVVTDVTGTLANTTTTAHDNTVIGVVSQWGGQSTDPTKYPVGAPMLVQIRGVARVNIAANTVAANATVESSTVAGVGQAVTAATAVTVNVQGTLGGWGSLIAVALEAQGAKDTNNTIRCKLTI